MEIGKKGKFRNLEIISNIGPHAPSGMSDVPLSELARNSQRERRHLPRLSLSSEQFRHSMSGKIFSVTDLSEEGMGLWLCDSNDLLLFTVGGRFEGTLNLKREKYHVQARVRNINPDRIGCEFENISQSFLEGVAAFLDPATLGAELKLIPATETHSLWYHGPSGTDLVIRCGEDGLFEKVILYVLGSFVQWDKTEGVTTGRTAPSGFQSEIRGIHRLETLYLDSDDRPDPEKLGIAKTVVLSSNLSLETKNKLRLVFGD